MDKGNKNTKKIKPELPGGFRDFLPKDMIKRQEMIDKIKSVFESYGFSPIETPIIEKIDVLTGKSDDFNMSIFRTGIVPGKGEIKPEYFEELALRYDLTVPLARVIAANRQLPKPFKRYQVGPVFRGERQQKGRFRQFYQFDADIVGSSSIYSDIEIILLIIETMRSLGVSDFKVRINNRKVLDDLISIIGLPNQTRKKAVFRVLDKLDKISWNEVAKELKDKLMLSEKSVGLIKGFLQIRGKADDVIDSLEKFFSENGKLKPNGLIELRKIISFIKKLGISEKNWQIDLSIARGLDYYTGTVFETTLSNLKSIGSVFSGGRYDGLVNVFSSEKLPAVGASIGVDRLFVALNEEEKSDKESLTDALIVFFEEELAADYFLIAKNLREGGIKTEIYLENGKTVKEQINYALKKGIRFLVIFGSDEKKEGRVAIKDLERRKQEKVSLSMAVDYIKKQLG